MSQQSPEIEDEGGLAPQPQANDTLLTQPTTQPSIKPSSPATPTSHPGWDPVPANLLAYFMATATFCLTFNIWDMPNLPFPLVGNLLPLSHQQIPIADFERYINPAVLLLFLWGLHYLRRFGEVMFVHVYSRTMSRVECVGASIYYSFFGLWIGWSTNIHLEYFPPKGWIFALGVLLFVAGEIGNFLSHLALRRLRQPKTKKTPTSGDIEVGEDRNEQVVTNGRVMPDGFLFRLVSSPNYLFEMISWLGYAIASFTLASYVFLLAGVITMCFYAHKMHVTYREYFDGEDGKPLYPRNRKRMIPFIF